jgi:hypothetical protein
VRTPQAPARRPTPLEEWAIVTDRVSKDPEAFIRFLNERIRRDGDCRLWAGQSKGTQYGYLTVSLWYDGQQFLVYVHRLFLTLMLRHPIPEGFHAAHDHAICPHKNCVFHLYLEHGSDNCRESATRMNRARQEAH